jgi:hypothetical protein
VKIWPEVGIAAWQNGAGGAFRLWVLAKAIDSKGSGVVTDTTLRGKAAELGVHDRTYRRWRSAATSLGLFEVLRRRSGETYRLASWGNGCKALGCSRVGSRYVIIQLSKLFKKGWKGAIYAACLTRRGSPKKYIYHDKKDDHVKEKIITVFSPISREKIKDLTGIPATTQRRLERQAGINVWFAYANAGAAPDDPDDIRVASEEHPVFIYKRRFRRSKKVIEIEDLAWQLPNVYKVPKRVAEAGQRGRSRKINAVLSVGSSLPSRGPELKHRRLYYSDRKAATEARAGHVADGISGETYALMPKWTPARKTSKRRKSYVYEVLPHAI